MVNLPHALSKKLPIQLDAKEQWNERTEKPIDMTKPSTRYEFIDKENLPLEPPCSKLYRVAFSPLSTSRVAFSSHPIYFEVW